MAPVEEGKTEKEEVQVAASAADTFAPREITAMSRPDSLVLADSSTVNSKPALSGKMKTTPKQGWKDSPTQLPEGWKFRCLPRKVGRKKQTWFLSPQVSSQLSYKFATFIFQFLGTILSRLPRGRRNSKKEQGRSSMKRSNHLHCLTLNIICPFILRQVNKRLK